MDHREQTREPHAVVHAVSRLGAVHFDVVERTDGAEICVEAPGLSLAVTIADDACEAFGRRLIAIGEAVRARRERLRLTLDPAWLAGRGR